MADNTNTNSIGGDAIAGPAQPTTDATRSFVDMLREYGADDAVVGKVRDELGVTNESDLALLNEQDLVGAGLKVVQARKLLNSLVQPVPHAVTDSTAMGSVALDAVLPMVPDDGSWLNMLQTGGILKVGQSSVMSAVRAGLANRVGLYDVPGKLSAEMEQFADNNDEQVPPEFYALRKQLSRRSYAEIFEAIDGLDGNFVTDARRRQMFERIDQNLWPAVFSFYEQLKGWQESWAQQSANPALFMQALSSMTGGGGLAMPAGMMQPPDTGTLRDAAAAVNDSINRVFAGTGVQIAAALAYDAQQIRKTLEDPRLPSLVGAANREQMLRQLGVSVSSTYARLEVNLTRFVLGVMQAQDQVAGSEEYQYYGMLYMLGSQIPWDTLGARGDRLSGIIGRQAVRSSGL